METIDTKEKKISILLKPELTEQSNCLSESIQFVDPSFLFCGSQFVDSSFLFLFWWQRKSGNGSGSGSVVPLRAAALRPAAVKGL